MNNLCSVFSSSLPAASCYLSLFHLAACKARCPWEGRKDGSGGACASPPVKQQCPFALGSLHLQWVDFFAFPSSLLLLEQDHKDISSSWYEMVVVLGHSLRAVSLCFMSAQDCYLGREDSLQNKGVIEGGAPAELTGLRSAKGLQCSLCPVWDLFVYLQSS